MHPLCPHACVVAAHRCVGLQHTDALAWGGECQQGARSRADGGAELSTLPAASWVVNSGTQGRLLMVVVAACCLPGLPICRFSCWAHADMQDRLACLAGSLWASDCQRRRVCAAVGAPQGYPLSVRRKDTRRRPSQSHHEAPVLCRRGAPLTHAIRSLGSEVWLHSELFAPIDARQGATRQGEEGASSAHARWFPKFTLLVASPDHKAASASPYKRCRPPSSRGALRSPAPPLLLAPRSYELQYRRGYSGNAAGPEGAARGLAGQRTRRPSAVLRAAAAGGVYRAPEATWRS